MEQHDQHRPEARGPRTEIAPAAAPPLAEASESSPDVMNIIADIEQQLERVRSYQQAHDEQVKTLAERAGAIEAARRELDTLAAAFQQREALLGDERRRLEEDRGAIRRLEAEVASRQATLDEERSALLKREETVQARQEALSSDAATLAAERRAAAEERAALETRVQRAERNVGELIQRIETMRAEAEQAASDAGRMRNRLGEVTQQLDEAQRAAELTAGERDEALARAAETERRVESGRAECASLQTTLAKQDSELVEARRKLDTAGAKLSQFAKALSEQTVKLERHAAALAELEQQRQQIKRLEEQLAASRLAGDPAEVERKDRRIAELTDALRESRGQSSAAPDLAAKDQRIAELTADVEASRLEANQSGLEVARLREELEAARQQAIAPSTDDSRVVALHARVAELEAALGRASAAPGAADEGGEHARSAEELRRKAERIKSAARHLVQRKDRLRRVRQALRERAADAGIAGQAPARETAEAAHAEHERLMRQAAQLQQHREELRQVQAMLVHSEQDMVRRWARPRAVMTLASALVVTIILAAGSWIAADHFFPARIAATVTLEAAPRAGDALTAADAAQWQSWHRNLIENESFHTALSQRLASRQVPGYDAPALVAERLQRDLSMDSTQDDRLTLTLAGDDDTETTAFLDALAATMIAESSRHVGKRSDGAKAVILGERRSPGQVQFASVNPQPITDQRLRYAGIILGVSLVCSFALVIIIYRKLAQAQRIFDEGPSVLDESGPEKPVAIR